METHSRSFVKGISWRIIATFITTGLTYFFTGDLSIAALVGSTEAISKILLYWGHERLWQQIPWGKVFPTPGSL